MQRSGACGFLEGGFCASVEGVGGPGAGASPEGAGPGSGCGWLFGAQVAQAFSASPNLPSQEHPESVRPTPGIWGPDVTTGRWCRWPGELCWVLDTLISPSPFSCPTPEAQACNHSHCEARSQGQGQPGQLHETVSNQNREGSSVAECEPRRVRAWSTPHRERRKEQPRELRRDGVRDTKAAAATTTPTSQGQAPAPAQQPKARPEEAEDSWPRG